MTTQTLDRYIEITPDIAGGKPRIAGRRITVQNIVIWHEWMGQSADEIATEFNLALAEIYAALAYYYDNPKEIDDAIKTGQELVEEMRRSVPSKLPYKISQ